jgi:two-component system, response regulator
MGKVILLVEDDASDEKLTLRAFRKLDASSEFVVAHDGAEALDYLEGSGRYAANPRPLPAMVLLDLKLPRVDGLEVLRRIRANPKTRNLPVAILTGSNAGEDRARSFSFGATAYVRKPVDFNEFIEAADALWRLWQVLDDAPQAIEPEPGAPVRPLKPCPS